MRKRLKVPNCIAPAHSRESVRACVISSHVLRWRSAISVQTIVHNSAGLSYFHKLFIVEWVLATQIVPHCSIMTCSLAVYQRIQCSKQFSREDKQEMSTSQMSQRIDVVSRVCKALDPLVTHTHARMWPMWVPSVHAFNRTMQEVKVWTSLINSNTGIRFTALCIWLFSIWL